MKLEKQGSFVSGDRPGSLSVPHTVTSLTPLRIAAMSETELRSVLPELVAALQHGEVTRPDWWPHSTIPWTPHHNRAVKNASSASLRSLVSKCYNYLTQHPIKLAPAEPRIPTQPRVLDWLNSNPPSRSCAQPRKNCGISSTKQKCRGRLPYVELHQCYQCQQEFPSIDVLQKHQVQCSGGSLALSAPSTPPTSNTPTPSPTPPTVSSSDDTSSSIGGALSNPATTTTSSSPGPVSFRVFIAALDLVPVHRARKIRQAQRRNTECETIDLEEPQTPISPPTPRTPKLLISLLSREGGSSSSGGGGGGYGSQGPASRRRLSYRPQSVEKPEDAHKEEQLSESDDEGSESGADDADEPKLHKKSLFSIDVTSGLGQRVLRHMTLEGHVPVILDSEQFCRTPIKDKYQDRLRTRQMSYPITWKLTGKRLRQQTHCHLYNFTGAQKFDFMEKMRTGLNWRCRKLLGCVKRCSVVVKRLSVKTLHKWKPSLNKVSVSLKPLTREEILLWTRPKPERDQSVSMATSLATLLASVDQALRLNHDSCCTASSGSRSWQVTTSPVGVIPARGSNGQLVNNCCRVKLEEICTLGNDLSSVPLTSDNPGSLSLSGRDSWVLGDVKMPLKIDIPLVSGVVSSARSTKNSPLDDSFSVMTVSSSDEENNRNAVCCALCSARNKSFSSPQRLSCSTARRCSHSPASSASVGSMVHPDTSSPGTALSPAGTLSSLPPITPPCLSPISHNVQLCPLSPASSLKSSRCRSHREHTLSHLRSCACILKSPLAQHDSSMTAVNHLTAALSESVKMKRERTGLIRNGAVPKMSGNITDPKIVAGGPKTRSSSKVTRSGSLGRREQAPQWAGKQIWRARSCSTRHSRQTDKTYSAANANGYSSGLHCRQQKRVQVRKGNPSSWDRTGQETNARSVCGSTANGSDSTDGRLSSSVVGQEDQTEGTRYVSSSTPKKRLMNGDVVSACPTLPHSLDVQEVCSNYHRQTELGGVESENRTDLSDARNVKDATKLAVSVAQGDESDSIASSPTSFLGENPFLLSKAQTSHFSSSILRQARQHWMSPPHKPSSREALRYGNSCQAGNAALSSPPHDKCAAVTSDKSTGSIEASVPVSSGSPRLSAPSPQKSDVSEMSQCSLGKIDRQCSPEKTFTPSPARKLLTAMQMMSVLEAARSKSPQGKSRPSGESSLRRRKRRKGHSRPVSLSPKSGYHTRGQESLFATCPGKRARLVD
ncbi:uncharacterized protein LOC143284933 isoform X2 [Babylonia areolata]|uniref:uncharacterized protein LOC143284933 isoform X2 n=1 Tax=Babylonia areolata TaxID=304850 RepID=UPI003FD2020B